MVRRDDDNILKKAMMLEVNGQRKRGRPEITWRQVEESVKKVGLKIEEAADRTRWRENVRTIAEGMRCVFGHKEKTGLKVDDELFSIARSFDEHYVIELISLKTL